MLPRSASLAPFAPAPVAPVAPAPVAAAPVAAVPVAAVPVAPVVSVASARDASGACDARGACDASGIRDARDACGASVAVVFVVFAAAVAFVPFATPAQSHTHGNMAGSLRPDSVIIWTRASQDALVSVRYGTDPTLTIAQETARALVTGTTDFTSKTRLTGLQPATRYHYATRLTNPINPSITVLSPICRFKTAPTNAQDAPVTFLFGADCIATRKVEYTTFDWMQRHQAADFYVSMGDMPYADGAATIPDYRAKHRDVRNDAKWWSFCQRFPVEATVDDHEVLNNWDAGTSPALVANGLAVFKEYYPFPAGTQQIYRSLPWGKALEIFLLDTRQYRGVNGSPSVPGKSMLGTTQKQWLLQALRDSKATFKVVVTSVPLRHGSASDTWVGFGRERQEIFRFVQQQGVRNVVFVTGDNHIAAVHHHREGFREYMVGPVAQFIGTGRPSDPEMRWRSRQRNYGLIAVDPTAAPPALTVEVHGASGLLRRETILAQAPATVHVTTDAPDGGFRMQGPAFYRNRGSSAGLLRVEPGAYRVSFDPQLPLDDVPAVADVAIPPGSAVSIAAGFRDVDRRTVLLAEDFETPLAGFTIVDETTGGGPSAWYTDQGYLVQASNINGAGDPARPGTIAWKGSTAWTDYTVSVRARPRDNDAFGVVFRYFNKDNYYRFSMDSQRGHRRLVRKVNGSFQILAEDTMAYDPDNWYDIQAVATGDRLQIRVGPDRIFDVRDAAIPRGGVGLYTWANLVTFFEDLIVTAGDTAGAPPARALARDEFGDGQMLGWNVADQTGQSAPSAWRETGGRLRQTSNIGASITASTGISRPGSVATLRTASFGDFRYSVRVRSGDNDGIGVVFRYRDAANHYRFSWDSERHLRRLTRVIGGVWSVLHEDNTPYTPDQWYTIRCVCAGSRIEVHVDDERVIDVRDNAHASGFVGLYVWANDDTSFDSLLVRPILPVRPILWSVTSNRVSEIRGRAPGSAQQLYGLALSFGREPGIPLAWLNPADPRTLELTPDFLFLESLNPSPLWPGFQGRVGAAGELSARVLWPNLPALRGTTIYAGGWTGDVARGSVLELLPTLEIVYP